MVPVLLESGLQNMAMRSQRHSKAQENDDDDSITAKRRVELQWQGDFLEEKGGGAFSFQYCIVLQL